MTDLPTHPSTEAAGWRKSTGSWPYPCPNGACSHAGHFHDIDTYEDPKPMCTFEDCPCGKPTTAPSTEAVGEVRRQIAEQIAARYAAGWLDPAAAAKLRSDLSAMTSDRDWLRGELGKAAAEIADLRGERDAAMRNWTDVQDRWEALQPVFEAAVVRAQVIRDLREFGSGSEGWAERDIESDADLLDAVEKWQNDQPKED